MLPQKQLPDPCFLSQSQPEIISSSYYTGAELSSVNDKMFIGLNLNLRLFHLPTDHIELDMEEAPEVSIST